LLGVGHAGLTAIDVAINNRNVAMVRKLETRAQFQAMLLMKVPKWANLGSEWKPRYSTQYKLDLMPSSTTLLVNFT